MHRATRTLLLFALAGSVLFLAACPPHPSIGEVNRDPARFAGKEIVLSGNVSEAIGALGFGFFKLDDGSGQIWVYSDQYGVPAQGSRTAITGRIDVQGISVLGKSYGTILRQTQRR
jgi:hypothetical protein